MDLTKQLAFTRENVVQEAAQLALELADDDGMDHSFAPFEIDSVWNKLSTMHQQSASDVLSESIRDLLDDEHSARYSNPEHAARWEKEIIGDDA